MEYRRKGQQKVRFNRGFFVLLVVFGLLSPSFAAAQASTPATSAPEAPKKLVEGQIAVNVPQSTDMSSSNWGHEVGTAVAESLKAIREEVPEMANTQIGRLATFLVVWKVVGKDFMSVASVFYTKFVVICIFPVLLTQYWRKIAKPIFDKILANGAKTESDQTLGVTSLIIGIILCFIWIVNLL